ncbi:DUF4815 domain-containing protein [Camelimonas lactis]|uniref:Uncharacterized protein DUF4815 n=1 Tax=Camelimonas lactis TaxID=659006 RepID=A0A4R2GU37_9HYPH|nr:DUF4815 domain-containing protein [Camelimonas lactis]TCO12445.1 uncharacterized protein DUF4815 [Camelimonas lactis]
MAYEHPSGIPGAYSRAAARPSDTAVVFAEGEFAQATDHNDAHAIQRQRTQRVGNMVAKDGDRLSGADIQITLAVAGDPPVLVEPMRGDLALAAGRIYVAGDVRDVAAATFVDVALAGEITVGVRLVRDIVTAADDPSLLGLHPGTEAEGEIGSAREVEHIAWALPGDGQPGEYYPVYTVLHGAVIDQTPPPALSGVLNTIALYDRDVNGNYIVDGCQVLALGNTGAGQAFSIAAGTANIQGHKRIREAGIRHTEPETPDLEAITAEPHVFGGPDGGEAIITVSRPPIAAVGQVVLVRRATATVTRGVIAGGADALPHAAVVEIESVKQGATTYVAGTDYLLVADSVSWSPAGAEPVGSSTYSVTYLYNALVAPTEVTASTVKVAGGVNGRAALVSYTSKMPRIDILCLDASGRPVYVKGIPARQGGLAPQPPATLLKLAEITNNWVSTPTVRSNGTRSLSQDMLNRIANKLLDVIDTFDRSEAQRDIQSRAGVATRGIFTDMFVDDFYRDQGEPQTAAINRGVLMLAIDSVLVARAGSATETLPWTPEVVIRQDKATSAMRINPYDNYAIMPGALRLEPPTDYWTESVTQWTSPVTMEFSAAPNQPPGSTGFDEVASRNQTAAQVMRQINVTATIDGFAAGENLKTLTMDGVDIKPPGVQTADANGRIVVTYQIPAGMPVGRRLVRAEGMADSYAEAIYVGEGIIDTTVMRRVTLVAQAAPIPVINVINNTTVINNITEVINVTQPVVAPFPFGIDPLACSFTLVEARCLVGVRLKADAVGDPNKPVRIQLATVENGWPTNVVLADTLVSMIGVAPGDVITAWFAAPVFVAAGREYCWVALTTDSEHAISIARLGEVDAATQQRVASQPYTVGVLFSSANRQTWTVHQDADPWFELLAAKFTATSRTIDLWEGDLDQVSDLLVRGAIEIPTADAGCRYELVRANGDVIPLAPGQTWEAREYVTEHVKLRAVLTGNERISPVLYPGTAIIGGRIRASGDYVSRLFAMGNPVQVRGVMSTLLPAGSSLTVEVDNGAGVWSPLDPDGGEVLGGGWSDALYRRAAHTAAQGRIRLTLTGGPAARPSVARLRAASI